LRQPARKPVVVVAPEAAEAVVALAAEAVVTEPMLMAPPVAAVLIASPATIVLNVGIEFPPKGSIALVPDIF
jgi:hypothetical protein